MSKKSTKLRRALTREIRANVAAAAKIAADAGSRPSAEETIRRNHHLAAAQDLRDQRRLVPKPKAKAKPSTKVAVRSEPGYWRDGRSYFRALAAAQGVLVANYDRATALRDLGAAARGDAFRRGQRATKRDLMARASGAQFEIAAVNVSPSGEVRDLSMDAYGAGGVFAPEIWALDKWWDVPRAEAPTRAAVTKFPLPEGCSMLAIPGVANSGNVAAVAENLDPVDFWTDTGEGQYPVVAVAGMMPLSQQLLDRGPNIDSAVHASLSASYTAAIEGLILNGSGDGEPLGLLNVAIPADSQISYVAATSTPASLISATAQAFAAVGNARLRPASHVIVSPERYAWLTSSSSSAGSTIPLELPGLGSAGGDKGRWSAVVASTPTLLSGAMPQDLGAAEDEDAIVVSRLSDHYLFESDPQFRILIDTQGGAEQLTVFAQFWTYVVFAPDRYLTATATVTGSGMSRSSLWG